jgi:hypothetical protein
VTRRVVVGLSGAAVLFLALAALVSGKSVPGLVEVEARGHDVLPDLPQGVEVARIRVAGIATLHVDLARGNVEDAVTGFFLTAMAAAAVLTGLLLSSLGALRSLVRFYLISGAATAFLAADELLSLHESIGYNIQPLFPGVERPNNLVVGLYVLLAVASLVVFRRELWRGRTRKVLFTAAATLFALSVLLDVVQAEGEEPAEIVGAACAGVGFLTLVADDLRAHLALAPRGSLSADPYDASTIPPGGTRIGAG